MGGGTRNDLGRAIPIVDVARVYLLYALLKEVTRSRTERINSNSSPFLV